MTVAQVENGDVDLERVGNREQFFAERKIASDFEGWPKCERSEQLRAP